MKELKLTGNDVTLESAWLVRTGIFVMNGLK